MQAVLVMFRSDGERRSFSLTRDITVIGRREDCDLRIPLGDVSRKHCRLVKDGDTLRMEDLGSSNGSYHNGVRVEKDAVLQPGDSIQVGPVVFVLQVDGFPADEELHPITTDAATPGPGLDQDYASPTLAEDEDLAPAAPTKAAKPSMPVPPKMPAPPPLPAAAGAVAGAAGADALDDLDDLDNLEPLEEIGDLESADTSEPLALADSHPGHEASAGNGHGTNGGGNGTDDLDVLGLSDDQPATAGDDELDILEEAPSGAEDELKLDELDPIELEPDADPKANQPHGRQ